MSEDDQVTVTLSTKDASLVAMTLYGAALKCGDKKPTGARDWFTRLHDLFWDAIPSCEDCSRSAAETAGPIQDGQCNDCAEFDRYDPEKGL